jgi:hypothetical protein
VIWKPNQIFKKSEKEGRDPEREIAPSLFCDIDADVELVSTNGTGR